MSTIHLDPTPYTSRMAGFFLYVSNTTSKENGYLCFHDMEGMPREDLRINCSVHGRYVIYYNERINRTYPSYFSRYAYYELCELEVYGKHVTTRRKMCKIFHYFKTWDIFLYHPQTKLWGYIVILMSGRSFVRSIVRPSVPPISNPLLP